MRGPRSPVQSFEVASAGKKPDGSKGAHTRREVLAAMAKYSAAVGGTAATIVTAEGLVSAASAYGTAADRLERFCQRKPDHKKCSGRVTF